VISKSLLELMGGQLSVNSVLGQGSTFKLELPVSLASTDEISVVAEWRPVQSLAPGQPSWRLLVVDDIADNRLLLTRLLTGVGFQVREAENGAEAVRVFEEWHPALCWMDMRMPIMDGYQATKKIRQLEGGDKVKIVALTASVFKEQHEEMIKAGCDAVLHKPAPANEVFAALSQHLGVKFIYQEQPSPPSSDKYELSYEMLSVLPLELRQKLHIAAANLDVDETDAVIAKIRKISPDIASSLEKLVQDYQFDQLIQLTETATSATVNLNTNSENLDLNNQG
jgi:CheY-like chemotaxis protein